MTTQGTSSPCFWRRFLGGKEDHAYFIFGLAVFCCIGIAKLGTPSLWMDEILVPLTSVHSMDFILAQSSQIEIHPPLVYFLTKASFLLGMDDFAMRLFPLALAFLSLLALYRALRVVLPASASSIATVLLMANMQFLFLARTIRPYSLTTLLFCLALYFYFRYATAETPKTGPAAWLGLVMAAAFSASYTTSFLIVSFFLAMAGTTVLTKRRLGARPLAVYTAICMAAVAFYYVFFISSSSVSQLHAHAGMDIGSITRIYANAVLENIFYFNNIPARLFFFALTLYGLFTLRRRLETWLLFALLLVVPYLQLIASHTALNFWGRHVYFLSVAAAVCQASAIDRLFSRCPVFVKRLVPLAILACVLIPYAHKFYKKDSYDVEIIGDNYKLIAKDLAALTTINAGLNFDAEYLQKCTGWYLGRFAEPALLANQDIEGEQRTNIIAAKNFEYIGSDRAAFIKRFGPFDAVYKAHSVELFTKRHEFAPTVIDKDAWTVACGFDYDALYGRALRIHNLNVAWESRGFTLVPTQYDKPCFIEYAIENKNGNPLANLIYAYENIGLGNAISIRIKYDGGEFKEVYASNTVGKTFEGIAPFPQAPAFTTAVIRVELFCADKTPTAPGTGLRGIRLSKLAVVSAKADQEKYFHDATFRMLNAFMLDSYGPELFLSDSRFGQTVSPEPATAASEVYETDGTYKSRIAFIRPADGKDETTIDVAYSGLPAAATFYPRLSGENASISVGFVNEKGEEAVYWRIVGDNAAWTPISAQYFLRLPSPSGTLRFHLTGRWSQLWTVDGKVLF